MGEGNLLVKNTNKGEGGCQSNAVISSDTRVGRKALASSRHQVVLASARDMPKKV